MRYAHKELAKKVLKRFNIGVTSYRRLQLLEESGRFSDVLKVIVGLPDRHKIELLNIVRQSHSQKGQDLFVLSELNFKRGGFFVEFGATNGVDLSNTNVLEKEFGWSGILAEPATKWHKDLRNNRSCAIETDCVWTQSGSTLLFREAGEFSTLDSYSATASYKNARESAKAYTVKTITLLDLLHRHKAPETVDYLSIDTEGSEYDILRSFNFDQYRFRVITCEHNFEQTREQVYSLLTKNGYVRKYEDISDIDDWYVMPGLI